jgi:hypothetical protein
MDKRRILARRYEVKISHGISRLLPLLISLSLISESDALDNVFSPHHEFRCDFVKEHETGVTVYLTALATEKRVKLLETPRWAEVYWSPIDTELALVDHWDGQASSIHILRVDPRAGVLQALEQYHSPELDTVGVEWEFKMWEIKKGKAWIRRRQVLKPIDAREKHVHLEIYCIPIN